MEVVKPLSTNLSWLMIALIYPIVLVCIFIIAVIYLFYKRWKISSFLIIIIVLVNWYIEFLPLNFNLKNISTDEYLTIATHNIYSQGDYLNNYRNNPDSLYSILKNCNADIIVIQEYDSIRCNKLNKMLALDGYNIYQKRYTHTYGENVIYSRFPIGNITYRQDGLIMIANLTYKENHILIINAHLNSNNINEKIINNNGKTDWFDRMPEYVKSVKEGEAKRKIEAKLIKSISDSCLLKKIPVIVLGDFNDIGGSKTLKTIEGRGETSLKDVWWNSGFGVGNTYHGYGWLNFRLDHILASNHFDILDVKIVQQPYSDHEILITKLRVR